MAVTISIPDYGERWTLNKAAGTGSLHTQGYERPVEYGYDQAIKMIRLARILGAQPVAEDAS